METELETTQLFPILNHEQIAYLSSYGDVRKIQKGEQLIKVGDRYHDFYVVLEGEVGIFNDGHQPIVIHQAGQFTGDSDTLSGRTAIFHAIAESDSTVLQIKQAKLKDIIARNQGLNEVLLRTFLLRRVYEVSQNLGAVKLFGSRYCPDTFKLREFFSRNHIQYSWVDLEYDETSESILSNFNVHAGETPFVITGGETIYKNPSLEKIAEVLGLSSYFSEEIFDVIVVGAGPAGLAASVYGASEGLKVVTIDSIGPGGQAGTSSRIENYLGFPMGISGSDLANNAYIQAQKFGCLISIPHLASSLCFKNNAFHLTMESGTILKGSTVIAASGARYRKLPIHNLGEYEGRGVYYGAGLMEAQTISGKEVIIVGGGNSAGQAALFLSERSIKVHLVIRGRDLEHSMSTYLISRIMNDEKIELHTHTEVKELHGHGWLEEVVMENRQTNERSHCKVADLFLFLGAMPCSDWLEQVTCLDKSGFVYTGRDIPAEALERYRWPLNDPPQSLETCVPGLFAVGDIRSGSVKRVASAVGEGSMAISQVHAFLSQRVL